MAGPDFGEVATFKLPNLSGPGTQVVAGKRSDSSSGTEDDDDDEKVVNVCKYSIYRMTLRIYTMPN